MARKVERYERTLGQPPGTMVHIGDRKTGRMKITLINYDSEHCEEREISTADEAFALSEGPTVSWINVDGLHDVDAIEKLGDRLGLHHLLLADIVNTAQRPKAEDYGRALFVIIKMLAYDESRQRIVSEQVSIVVMDNRVLTFQERPGDVFGPVRDRIRNGKGRIRKMGPDYLAHSLIDSVVDEYFIILEKLGASIEEVEEQLLDSPGPESLKTLHHLRRQLTALRKAVWPLREMINQLNRQDSPLVDEPTRPYFRDLYDHTMQVVETVETLRETVSALFDVYLSSVSNRMNEVMKVLTLIATIFIPLTFVAGVYGMNFDYMPELEWKWAYPAALALMAAIAVAMVLHFRRKGWL